MSKKFFIIALIIAVTTVSSFAQVAYSLPQTSISLDVEAIQEDFHAGPYAKYAHKYLGVNVRLLDEKTFQLSSVQMTFYIEADHSRRYFAPVDASNDLFLKLTSQGLVSSSGSEGFGSGVEWRFPVNSKGDFTNKGVNYNLKSETTSLYTAEKVAILQEVTIEKPLEIRAKEAAEMIFELRKKRIQIITGDTDASYGGDAMGAAIKEITRLEQEYLSLFIGYSEYRTQKKKFDILPERNAPKQFYVAFRLSDTEGLVTPENVSGKPYIIEIVPQTIAGASKDGKEKSSRWGYINYRIPSICTVKLTDGVNMLIQDRIPVYQLGKDEAMPIYVK